MFTASALPVGARFTIRNREWVLAQLREERVMDKDVWDLRLVETRSGRLASGVVPRIGGLTGSVAAAADIRVGSEPWLGYLFDFDKGQTIFVFGEPFQITEVHKGTDVMVVKMVAHRWNREVDWSDRSAAALAQAAMRRLEAPDAELYLPMVAPSVKFPV